MYGDSHLLGILQGRPPFLVIPAGSRGPVPGKVNKLYEQVSFGFIAYLCDGDEI